jgi:ankyrin repeat protein
MVATGWRPKHAAAQNLIANKVKDRRQLKATFDTIEDLDAFEDTRNGHLSLLFHAIILGNLAALQTLLEVGADPTKTNKRGINVLHLMAKRGQVVMSELCLKSIKNEDGKKGFVNNSSEIGKVDHEQSTLSKPFMGKLI